MEDIKSFFKKDNFIVDVGIELLEVSPGYAKARFSTSLIFHIA
jgi:acyl-CoA thioesterase